MDKKKRLAWQIPFLLLLIIGTILIIGQQRDIPYQHNEGFVFGTIYKITYQSDRDLHDDIKAALIGVDESLSAFNEKSILSQVNRDEDVALNKIFTDVFTLAQSVSDDTNGAFDITVAPLVNAWGFGFKNEKMPTKPEVDSMLQHIGYKKVSIVKNRIKKTDNDIMLDCAAIAKGYGCDVVAKILADKGVDNYMVDIGGEVVTKGISPKRLPWKIGVTKPIDDSLTVNQEIQSILNVTDKSMATSGNYRNFYYKNGKKYAHTIDPKTGYPVQHSLLSATVITDRCAIADAYATAFMVMGIDKARKVLQRHPEMMGYFIYSDAKGQLSVWYSPSLKDKIE